jgi:hypothetical protein
LIKGGPILNNVIREEELKPRKPNLSMKYLNELIQELQRENHLLTSRLEQVEQQLHVMDQIREEVAVAVEQPVIKDQALIVGMETPLLPVVYKAEIDTPRSERHPAPKKKFLWFKSAY